MKIINRIQQRVSLPDTAVSPLFGGASGKKRKRREKSRRKGKRKRTGDGITEGPGWLGGGGGGKEIPQNPPGGGGAK